MFTIGDILDLAIQIENNGERVYRDAAKKISDLSLVSMLEWLADEEAVHAAQLADMKEKAQKTVDDPRMEKMGRDILLDVLGEQSFSLKDADFLQISEVKDLLRVSIEFEKDTVLFYEMLLSFVDDETTKNVLETIINDENEHISKLEEFLTSELETG
jgi:rubrerythrin